MKRRLMTILLIGLLGIALFGCNLTSAAQTTASSAVTTTSTPTTTTTTTTTTTMPLSYQSVWIEGSDGDGSETNPFVVDAYALEQRSVPISILPFGYQAVVEVYQGVKTNVGIFPLTSAEQYDFDFTGTSTSEIVFEPLKLGTHYLVILVDGTHPTYLEVRVVRKPIDVDFTKTLKVLAIGNSFSVDAMQYLYKIAKDAGIETVILGNLYIAGAALSNHVISFNNSLANYTYYKNTNDQWTAQSNATLLDGLQDESWDVITIQQVSGSSGRIDTYQQLEALISIVNENKTNPDARIFWHMTWAYQQNSTHADFVYYSNNQLTMYQAIVGTVQSRIVDHPAIQTVIPAGTAIQNLRTSYMGDTLTVDGYHLSLIHGRYTAGLTWFAMITGLDIQTIQYAPTGITAQDLLAIKEAVGAAIANPYQITASTFTERNP
jgi:hypothetical protein